VAAAVAAVLAAARSSQQPQQQPAVDAAVALVPGGLRCRIGACRERTAGIATSQSSTQHTSTQDAAISHQEGCASCIAHRASLGLVGAWCLVLEVVQVGGARAR
jgi:hypothetical protein